MSHVTTHLGCKQHRQEFPFVQLCRTCWDHVVHVDEWQNFHVNDRCKCSLPQHQKRGVRVVEQWQKLYIKMYSQSRRIPSPCKFPSSNR
jgi:hypothetical protein